MFIYLVQTQGKSFSTRPSLPKKKLVVRSFYWIASQILVVFPVKGSPERKGDNPKSNMAENKLTVVWVCYPSSLLPSRNSLFFCFVNMQPREKGITAVWLLCDYFLDKFFCLLRFLFGPSMSYVERQYCVHIHCTHTLEVIWVLPYVEKISTIQQNRKDNIEAQMYIHQRSNWCSQKKKKTYKRINYFIQ